MATKNMAYDQATYEKRHATSFPGIVAASGVSAAKFLAFTDMKVKKINARVIIAGTADTAQWDILNGTSSVAAIVAGTSAIGTLLTAVTQNITLASDGYLDIRSNADNATTKGDFYIEYEFVPGANVTV